MKKVMDKKYAIEKYGSGFVASSGEKGGVPMFSRVGK